MSAPVAPAQTATRIPQYESRPDLRIRGGDAPAQQTRQYAAPVDLGSLIQRAQAARESRGGTYTPQQVADAILSSPAATMANPAQLDNLRTHPSVASRLAAGDLKLYGWVYNIETGHIHTYDLEHEQFVPLRSADQDATPRQRTRRPQLATQAT